MSAIFTSLGAAMGATGAPGAAGAPGTAGRLGAPGGPGATGGPVVTAGGTWAELGPTGAAAVVCVPWLLVVVRVRMG